MHTCRILPKNLKYILNTKTYDRLILQQGRYLRPNFFSLLSSRLKQSDVGRENKCVKSLDFNPEGER